MSTDTKTKTSTGSELKTEQSTGLSVRSLNDLPKLTAADGCENLCILGDTSGSMSSGYSAGKTRLQGLQEALTAIWEITDWASCDTIFYTFSDETRRIPFESVAPPIVENAQYGGTDFCIALDAALNNKDLSRVILASDGDAEYPEGQISKCQEKGIPIDTIFIGSDPEARGATQLRRISEETGGIFTLCSSAHELVAQFQALETNNRLALDYSPEGNDVIEL
jgi:hypothetical protein